MRIKSICRRILEILGLESVGRLYLQQSALKQSGWFRSVREKQSCDVNGSPIPWLSYPSLDFLETRVTKDHTIFEYGAGNSTLYFVDKAKFIHSVEHNSNWVDLVSKGLKQFGEASRITLKEIPDEYVGIDVKELSFVSNQNGYVNSIFESQHKYDIVIVDGLFRNSCAIAAQECLADRGVIIIDNTNYTNELNEGCSYLSEMGFKRLDFWGMCAVYSDKTCTSIFYRTDNCLDI